MRNSATSLNHRVGRLERLTKQCGTGGDLPPRPLQTAQDVIDLLEEQVTIIRQAPYVGTLEKARAIAHLAGMARQAIETGTMAARLEMLEAVLKQRRQSNRS